MFYIWAVGSIDDQNVTILIFCNRASFCAVEAAFDYIDAGCKVYFQRVCSFWKRDVLIAEFQIWAKSTFGADNVNSIQLSYGTRKFEKFESLLERDAFRLAYCLFSPSPF